jgi:hypothetical protein
MLMKVLELLMEETKGEFLGIACFGAALRVIRKI